MSYVWIKEEKSNASSGVSQMHRLGEIIEEWHNAYNNYLVIIIQ